MSSISDKVKTAKTLFDLYREKAQLSATHLLVSILSKVLLGAIGLVLVFAAIFFISIGVALLLSDVMGAVWAFIVVGVFYIALLAVVVIFSKQLFINRLSMIFSRIIISDPKTDNYDDTEEK